MVIRDYWEQIKLDRFNALVVFVVPGIAKVAILYIPPLILAKIIDQYGKTGFTNVRALLPYLIGVISIWSLGQVLMRWGIQLGIYMQTGGIRRLYNNGFDALLAKDISFFDNNFSGSLTKRLTSYARGFEYITDTLIFSVANNLIAFGFAVIILWLYSPWFVVALIGTMIITTITIMPLVKKRQKIVDERERLSALAVGNIADTIGNVAAVRTFGQEAFERKRHKNYVKNYVDMIVATWNFQNLKVDMATSPLYVLGNALGLILALYLSSQGQISLGTIFVAFSYFATTTGVVFEFTGIYRGIEGNLTEAAQFTKLLLDDPVIEDPAHAAPFTVMTPSVKLDAIEFRYVDNGGEHLFKNLTLDVKSGEKIGLVGPSGGGKSTIAKLILRIMDVTSGTITVSDRDIRTIKQTDLRQSIAYVPQDPILFHRSLAENIAYGKMDATQDEIEAAAKLARAHDFIQKLPEGYQTLVGERGVKLSGGQRQRVSIARAILKDAPILVLDEATSALDSESESLIQEALTNLMKHRTTIVIAHRLSTIQKMDRIIVLEEGVITEQGTHTELLKKKGLYAKLWDHQSGGFLED